MAQDPRYCGQWNEPPVRYEGEHGTMTFKSGCGFPSRWAAWILSEHKEYTCDAHLSQAVGKVMDAHPHLAPPLSVAPYLVEKDGSC